MAEHGIVEVTDPSGLFLSRHDEPVPGTCVTVTMEGRRPLLAEVQALVAPDPAADPAPGGARDGLRPDRDGAGRPAAPARLPLHSHDVYVSTVGGARVVDPSADLAAAVAVASTTRNASIDRRIVAIGEVGLAGELRRVPGLDRRLAEAARLGFTEAVIPADSGSARDRMTSSRHGLLVHRAPTIEHALRMLSLTGPQTEPPRPSGSVADEHVGGCARATLESG